MRAGARIRIAVFGAAWLAAAPAAVVAVTVTNPGAQVGTLNSAYTYVEPPSPVRIVLAKSGNDVLISWTATGQPSYTIFRQPSPAGFTGSSIIGTTAAATFTDVLGLSQPGIQFYQVD